MIQRGELECLEWQAEWEDSRVAWEAGLGSLTNPVSSQSRIPGSLLWLLQACECGLAPAHTRTHAPEMRSSDDDGHA